MLENNIVCDICRKDKIKTIDNKCIVKGKIHENCLIASNSLACSVCYPGYLLE